MLIKEKIKYSGTDEYIKFNISSNNDVIDYQQAIDQIIIDIGNSLINPINDQEVIRFKNNITTFFKFYFFYGNTINLYGNDFYYAGFNTNDITQLNSKIINSFFIFDLYDTVDTNTQTKICRTYLTNLITPNSIIPSYTIDAADLINDLPNTSQLHYWNIPVSYISANSGITTQFITAYMKVLFFNANDSRVIPFYNYDIYNPQSSDTSEYMYFETILDFKNNIWTIPINNYNPRAYELISNTYATKVNQTVTTIENLKQNYGGAVGTFNPTTQNYQ